MRRLPGSETDERAVQPLNASLQTEVIPFWMFTVRIAVLWLERHGLDSIFPEPLMVRMPL